MNIAPSLDARTTTLPDGLPDSRRQDVGVQEEDATDAERRQRRLRDPDVPDRLQEIREAIAHEPTSSGITAEELPEFLRE